MVLGRKPAYFFLILLSIAGIASVIVTLITGWLSDVQRSPIQHSSPSESVTATGAATPRENANRAPPVKPDRQIVSVNKITDPTSQQWPALFARSKEEILKNRRILQDGGELSNGALDEIERLLLELYGIARNMNDNGEALHDVASLDVDIAIAEKEILGSAAKERRLKERENDPMHYKGNPGNLVTMLLNDDVDIGYVHRNLANLEPEEISDAIRQGLYQLYQDPRQNVERRMLAFNVLSTYNRVYQLAWPDGFERIARHSALNDAEAGIRRVSLTILDASNNDDRSSLLSIFQNDPSDDVAIAAAKMLISSAETHEIRILIYALRSDNAVTRRRGLADLLSSIPLQHAQDVIPVLDDVSRLDSSEDVQEAAKRSIAEIHRRTQQERPSEEKQDIHRRLIHFIDKTAGWKEQFQTLKEEINKGALKEGTLEDAIQLMRRNLLSEEYYLNLYKKKLGSDDLYLKARRSFDEILKLLPE